MANKRLNAVAKGRLLWRSDLVLIDGTRLPGVAIVSYANPFGGPDQDDGLASLHDAEADLCLALEMLRNQPLRIASLNDDASTSQTTAVTGQKQSHWVASGDVRVYIDPRERATWSYFRRLFCFDADFVQDTGAERSTRVLTVSLQPSLLAPGVGNASSDPFAIVNTPTSPHAEFCIFAQPEAPSHPASSVSDPMPIRLVLGRRVTVVTRRAGQSVAGKELSRSRTFSRQPSVGSQTLHDMFSQAGLSLPAFGGMPSLSTNAAPRPDDPLPRGSISALLQARSKRKPAHTQRNGGVSSAGPSSLPAPPATGTHTPGRRGEKRRSSSDHKVAGSPGPPEHLDEIVLFPTHSINHSAASPSKAIKHRADRILIDLPRLNLGKQPTRSDVATILHKASSVPPEQQAKQSSMLLDVKPLVKTESVSPSPEPFLLPDTKPSDSVEKSNRNLIKKVVHTLLIRDHHLSKSHPDYIATYNQTCSGTWCTFRNVATSTSLSRDTVEDVVRIHLSLYLYSSPTNHS